MRREEGRDAVPEAGLEHSLDAKAAHVRSLAKAIGELAVRCFGSRLLSFQRQMEPRHRANWTQINTPKVRFDQSSDQERVDARPQRQVGSREEKKNRAKTRFQIEPQRSMHNAEHIVEGNTSEKR